MYNFWKKNKDVSIYLSIPGRTLENSGTRTIRGKGKVYHQGAGHGKPKLASGGGNRRKQPYQKTLCPGGNQNSTDFIYSSNTQEAKLLEQIITGTKTRVDTYKRWVLERGRGEDGDGPKHQNYVSQILAWSGWTKGNLPEARTPLGSKSNQIYN